MSGEFTPRTYKIVLEGIAVNYLLYPHFRPFIETDSNSPTVIMTTNHVSEAHKVDFENAMGGTRKDDGRSGIFVYMRWSDTPEMGESVTITVWQQGAKKYGAPEPMHEDGFDPDNPTAIFEQGAIST